MRMMTTIQKIIARRRRVRSVRPRRARKRGVKRRSARRMKVRKIAILCSTTRRWSTLAPHLNVDASAKRRNRHKRKRNLRPQVTARLYPI